VAARVRRGVGKEVQEVGRVWCAVEGSSDISIRRSRDDGRKDREVGKVVRAGVALRIVEDRRSTAAQVDAEAGVVVNDVGADGVAGGCGVGIAAANLDARSAVESNRVARAGSGAADG